MKVYMVIYLVGQIVGSVGPLPYDMAECERRAAEKMERAAQTHPNAVTPEGLTLKDVQLRCEWRNGHPKPAKMSGA